MIPLAQVEAANSVADGLAKNPLAYVCALAILGAAFTLRGWLSEKDKSAATINALNQTMIVNMREDAKEQREILQEVIPLAAKLVDGVDTLERVTDKLTSRGA
jgi:hypothetical protein